MMEHERDREAKEGEEKVEEEEDNSNLTIFHN